MDSFRFYREQAENRLTRALDNYLTSAHEDEEFDEEEDDDYQKERELEEDYLYELGENDDNY